MADGTQLGVTSGEALIERLPALGDGDDGVGRGRLSEECTRPGKEAGPLPIGEKTVVADADEAAG